MVELGRIRILLVDDDEDDFVVLRDLVGEIEGSRPSLEWADSFEKGLEAVASPKHDLYLFDYRLGEKTGLDLLQAALERGLKAPVIVLTGYGDHEIDLKAMQMGAADYLVKTQITSALLERAIRYSIFRAQSIDDLRSRELNFRSLFNSTFEGILIHDHGRILDANESAGRIFGLPRRELVGRSFYDFVTPDSRAAIESAVTTGSTTDYEITGKRADGARFALEVQGKDYDYQGRPVRLSALHDVTARKQMESQVMLQDRLASIGLLASSLAHEIGTPLGVIRGRAEFLGLQLKDDETIRKNVEVISHQIDRVSKLIRSLLNLARGGSGPAGPVQLRNCAAEVLELMSYELTRQGIAIENNIDEATTVKAEAEPLHQVVLNLLVNATHAIESAMQAGRGSGHFVRLSNEVVDGMVALRVEDSGSGISPANLKNIFKPFFTTKDIGKGTGLGLVTSYRIVEGWGGRMTVQSEEGKGTVFRVLLPRA